MSKPVVTFNQVYGEVACGCGVMVAGYKGHPRLADGTGAADCAYTTPIVRIERGPDNNLIEFETQNTIYRQV